MRAHGVALHAVPDTALTPLPSFDPARFPVLARHWFGLDVFDISPGALAALGADRQCEFRFSVLAGAAAFRGDKVLP